MTPRLLAASLVGFGCGVSATLVLLLLAMSVPAELPEAEFDSEGSAGNWPGGNALLETSPVRRAGFQGWTHRRFSAAECELLAAVTKEVSD